MELLKLFYVFFTIGLFSIGGGYAIIPLIQEQVVEKYGWLTLKTFTDVITISQMTPGPIAVNTSTFVGMQISGLFGAIVATIGCIIGGIAVSTLLYLFFKKHQESVYVFEVLKGLKASSLGLIISAAAVILLISFSGSSEFIDISHIDYAAILLFVLAFIALRKGKINPILIMVITGVVGGFIY